MGKAFAFHTFNGNVGFALAPPVMALLITAFARPRLGKGSSEIEASGIDIVLALDVSGSMNEPYGCSSSPGRSSL